jgi:hypothetical protein
MVREQPGSHRSANRERREELAQRLSVAPAKDALVRGTDDVAPICPRRIAGPDVELAEHRGEGGPDSVRLASVGDAAKDSRDDLLDSDIGTLHNV